MPLPASAVRHAGKGPARFIQWVPHIRHPAEHSSLGKASEYASSYTPSLLFPISRATKWAELGLSAETLPYRGVGIWNCYEPSWLTPANKPVAAIGEFSIPADSPNIIEPKSFKLYLNSLNQFAFDSREALRIVLEKDLSSVARAPVGVRLCSLDEVAEEDVERLSGRYIDELDIVVDGYEQPRPELLRCDVGRIVKEQLYSRLLKPNCPVIDRPDWGTLAVDYQGPALDLAGLLVYLVSLHQYQDSHGQCVERIFLDLQRLLQPQALSIRARYVCRGGLDINPYRSLAEVASDDRCLVRQ